MNINISNLYHRREQEAKGEIPTTYSYTLSKEFRVKFILELAELLNRTSSFYSNYAKNIVCKLRKVFGVFRLDELSFIQTYEDIDEIKHFIINEKNDSYILSAIEVICRYYKELNIYSLINITDDLFQYERIGYKFIIEQDVYIVKIEDEIFYNQCTAKTLSVLSEKKYDDAQNYFIDSYKKLSTSDYNDALVDIGRAMETVLKTRFTELNISFDAQKDTLNKLLDIGQQHITSQNHNFQYFKQIILDAGRARNTGGHGNVQGQAPALDEVYVRFVINQAAANLLFLAEVPMRSDPTTP